MELILFGFIVLLYILSICWHLGELIEKQNELTRAHFTEIMARHEKWLFDSLYSINNKVLLPDDLEKPVEDIPAKVYSPFKDPLNQFKGQKNDWHG